MNVTQSVNHGINVLSAEGNLDIAGAAEFESQTPEIAEGSRVVVDVSGVGFVASSGMRVLLKMAQQAKNVGASLAICGMNDTVREVFEVSGFDAIIPVEPTLEAALAAG